MNSLTDSGDGAYCLTLAKQDFKFSCGHFTLFGPDQAELLHGHNYHVAVELTGDTLDADGMLVDFPSVKSAIRKVCAYLDSRTLIPNLSPHLEITEEADEVEVRFRQRRYRMPSGDVRLLPLVNTSIEVLARWLWEELTAAVALPGITCLGVSVSETAGQSCRYSATLGDGEALAAD